MHAVKIFQPHGGHIVCVVITYISFLCACGWGSCSIGLWFIGDQFDSSSYLIYSREIGIIIENLQYLLLVLCI